MRVIAGEVKGRRLKTLDGLDVRPTTDKVKESLFSIIQFDLPGCRFLDLFSGSGQIGIEALSRGAEYAVFNDQSREAQAVIKENLTTVGLFKKSRVISMDAQAYLKSTKDVFDIIFLDPPYHHEILPAVLPLAVEKVQPHGMIICEHETSEEVPEQVGDFVRVKQYRYGKIMLSKYQIPQQEDY
ncbi:MAG: 16S rRNA (guanine(966)-N(2))-methyltransferase RsmD [Massiliimalia sp.]|jgi:16S rRNA (guanine966-N2)-methyltransferase